MVQMGWQKLGLERESQISYGRSLLLCLLAWTVIMGAAVAMLGIDQPYPGDEQRYINTAREFGQGLSWHLLQTYEEMSTPLPFVVFGAWGQGFGYSLPAMRIAALLMGLSTLLVLHHFARLTLRDSWLSLAVTLFWLVHPYVILLSVFVYTDILAMLFLMLAAVAVARRQPMLLAVGMMGGLLCRQYLVFAVAAAGVYYVLRYLHHREKRDVAMLVAIGVALLPMAGLVLLWGGLSPANEMKQLYLDRGLSFHPRAAVLYVCQMFIYLLPWVWLARRQIFASRKAAAIAVVIALVYWVFPIRPSRSAVAAEYETVGLFDRLLHVCLPWQGARDVWYFACLAVGLMVVWAVMRDAVRRWRAKELDAIWFAELGVFWFLLVMPMSYLAWEKYFLPVLPLALVALAAIHRDRNAAITPPLTPNPQSLTPSP